MPGPPPQPTERKRKLGNPGRQKLPDLSSVAAIEPVVTDIPAHLGAKGAEIWQHVTAGAVWLAETDKPTLVLLCEKIDRRELMRSELAKTSLVLYTDKLYAYPNPLVGMLSTIENEIAKLYSVLGLTPTDRTRMGVAEVKAKNAFEEMLAKRQARE